MPSVLIVDDDTELALEVKVSLERHSQDFQVEMAHDGGAALHCLKTRTYDLIILDWNLPDTSGPEICRAYRNRKGNAPVLMLTGMSSIGHKETGFDAGADDYLVKPFHSKELVLRAQALLRRRSEWSGTTLEWKQLKLEVETHQVEHSGTKLSLTPKEFLLLEYFMRHPQQVLSIEHLLNNVWRADETLTEDACRVCLKRLRNKLGSPCPISTIHGRGYSLD